MNLIDQLKDQALKLKEKIAQNPLEKALNEATSNENWNASTKILSEIADHTYNFNDFTQIMQHIWSKLSGQRKKWRKILKTLTLIEYLTKNGSPRCIQEFRDEIYQIRGLQDFSHYEDGADRGASIREVAKRAYELLNDDNRIDEERKKAQEMREKLGDIRGISNSSGGDWRGGGGSSSWKSGGGSKFEGYGSDSVGRSGGSSKYSGGGSDSYKRSDDNWKASGYDDDRKAGKWRVEDTVAESKYKEKESKDDHDFTVKAGTKYQVDLTKKEEKEVEKPKEVKKSGGGIPKIGQTGTQPTKTQTQTQQQADFDLLDDKPVGGSSNNTTTTTTSNNSTGNVFQWNQQGTTVTNTNTSSGNNTNSNQNPFGWGTSTQSTTPQQTTNTQTNNANPFNWGGNQQQTTNTVTNTNTNLTSLGNLYTQPSNTNTNNNFGGFNQQQPFQQQTTFQQTTFQQPSNNNSLGNVNFNAFGTSTTQQKTTTTTTTIQNTPPKSNSDFEFDDFQTAGGNNNNSKIKSIKPADEYKGFSEKEKKLIDLSDLASEDPRKKKQDSNSKKIDKDIDLDTNFSDLNLGGNNYSGGIGSSFNTGGFNQGGFNQGGYNQGGFNQGGFNQGGFNQGGFNQGGFNQGGFNQGGFGQQQQGFNQGGFNQGGFGQQQGFNQGGFNQGGFSQGGFGQQQQQQQQGGFGGNNNQNFNFGGFK